MLYDAACGVTRSQHIDLLIGNGRLAGLYEAARPSGARAP
jgi:hypothetical protein